MRLLERADAQRDVGQVVVATLVCAERATQSLLDDLQSFFEHRPEIVFGEPETRVLGRLPAAPDAELEAPAGKLVEHADLFEQADRMMQRQEIDQRAELDGRGPLRHRGEEHRGRRGHPEVGRVVLGQVVAVEAEPLVKLDQPQPGGVLLADRTPIGVDMVEHPEAHPARAHRTM